MLRIDMGQHHQAIQEVKGHHLIRITDRGEVVHLVPLLHQREVAKQLLLNLTRDRKCGRRYALLEDGLLTHATFSPSALIDLARLFRFR